MSRRGHALLRETRTFFGQLARKFVDDDAFFIAAALAWGILIALVPLLALAIGLTGFVLSARFESPADAVVELFARVLPQGGAELDFSRLLDALVAEVMVNRAGLTVVGAVVFVWFATRLSGSLRSALYTVFDVGARRGIIHGKMFDVVAVLVGVVLATLDMGVTLGLATALALGFDLFGLGGSALTYAQRLLAVSIAFASSWILFVLIYRYLPVRRTSWKKTLIAATFTALVHQGLKLAFSWYLTELAIYTSTLGNLATIAVLLLWIYYGAVVFIVGGEVAHVYTSCEARRAADRIRLAEEAGRAEAAGAAQRESARTGAG